MSEPEIPLTLKMSEVRYLIGLLALDDSEAAETSAALMDKIINQARAEEARREAEESD